MKRFRDFKTFIKHINRQDTPKGVNQILIIEVHEHMVMPLLLYQDILPTLTIFVEHLTYQENESFLMSLVWYV